jgi:hypothetical protein
VLIGSRFSPPFYFNSSDDNSGRGALTGWSGDATFLEYLHLNKYKEAKQIAYVIGNQTPGR